MARPGGWLDQADGDQASAAALHPLDSPLTPLPCKLFGSQQQWRSPTGKRISLPGSPCCVPRVATTSNGILGNGSPGVALDADFGVPGTLADMVLGCVPGGLCWGTLADMVLGFLAGHPHSPTASPYTMSNGVGEGKRGGSDSSRMQTRLRQRYLFSVMDLRRAEQRARAKAAGKRGES